MKKIVMILSFIGVAVLMLSQVFTARVSVVPSNYVPPLDGQLVLVRSATVARGIIAASQGQAGTMILGNGNKFLFVWQYEGQGAAFFGVNADGMTFWDVFEAIRSGGELANAKSTNDLISAMKSNGWTQVNPVEVPSAIVIGARLLAAANTLAVSSLGLYMVVPQGGNSIVPLFERYDSYKG